jgi:hypothetical protein
MIQVAVFWIVKPRSDAVGYQCFGGHATSTSLHPEDGGSMSSETLVSYHIIRPCHSPEDVHLKSAKFVHFT